MSSATRFDVAILGAGPAGCVAALRLLALGRTVAIIERQRFPRPHVGESLSAGVGELLRFVGAESALDDAPRMGGLATRLIWESPDPIVVPSNARSPNLVVDRGEFDARLASLVEARGATRFQGATVDRISTNPESCRLRVATAGVGREIEARTMIDARGRAATAGGERISLAAHTHCLWTEFSGDGLPRETRIEATADAWLWGAPLADGRRRVMAFCDPTALRATADPAGLLRRTLAESRLFAPLATAEFAGPLVSRASTPHLDVTSPLRSIVPVGDRALSLDPLSSSGVERAMRSALSGVLVVNTLLDRPDDAGLAEEFHLSRLVESAVEHVAWTAAYYGRAWPGSERPFWRDRARCLLSDDEFTVGSGDVRERLRRHWNLTRSRDQSVEQSGRSVAAPRLVDSVRRSPHVEIHSIPCAVGDYIERRPAVAHPRLPHPVAYLATIALAPLLDSLRDAFTVGDVLTRLAVEYGTARALDVLRWLVEHEILEVTTHDERT